MRLDYRYRSFDINNIFQQKLSYERHKKRLKELSTTQALNFNIFPDRTSQINRYRNSKHVSFIKELKERDKSINQSNLKIFQKLASTQDVARLTPELPYQPMTARKEDNPRRRRMSEQREHENERMQIRLKSLVSSINNRKINDEYRRSLQIRNRITRFQKNPLTHRKFVNLNTSGNLKVDAGKKSERYHPRSISNMAKEPIIDQQEKREKLIEKVRNNLTLKRKLRNAHASLLQADTTVRPETSRPKEELLSDRIDQDLETNAVFPTQIEQQHNRKSKTRVE